MNTSVVESLTKETCHELHLVKEKLQKLSQQTGLKMIGDDIDPPTYESMITTALLNIINVNARIHSEVQRLDTIIDTLPRVLSPESVILCQFGHFKNLILHYEERPGISSKPIIRLYWDGGRDWTGEIFPKSVRIIIMNGLSFEDFAFIQENTNSENPWYHETRLNEDKLKESISQFTQNDSWTLKMIEIEGGDEFIKVWDKNF